MRHNVGAAPVSLKLAVSGYLRQLKGRARGGEVCGGSDRWIDRHAWTIVTDRTPQSCAFYDICSHWEEAACLRTQLSIGL